MDGATHLRPVGAAVARHVAHDLREVARVLDDVDVAEHLEIRELGDDGRHLDVGRV